MTPQQAGYTTASDLDQCDDREVLADIREESIYWMLDRSCTVLSGLRDTVRHVDCGQIHR